MVCLHPTLKLSATSGWQHLRYWLFFMATLQKVHKWFDNTFKSPPTPLLPHSPTPTPNKEQSDIVFIWCDFTYYIKCISPRGHIGKLQHHMQPCISPRGIHIASTPRATMHISTRHSHRKASTPRATMHISTRHSHRKASTPHATMHISTRHSHRKASTPRAIQEAFT